MKKIILLLLSVVLLAANDDAKQKKPKPRFPVGKETTFVTEPLDADGYIDYAAALNEHWRRGVTPENNANVLMWKAFGPHPEGAKMPYEFFKWMGIKPPPEQGDYFISMRRFAREQLKVDPGNGVTAIEEELSRCSQQLWKESEHPNIAAWLKANEKPLAVVLEATKRTHYYSPMVPKGTKNGPALLINALLPGVQECRGLAWALTARALLRASEGQFDEAWQDLLACHRLGRLVAHGATLIDLLVGIAIDSVASKADLAFLESVDWQAEQIMSRLRPLRELAAMPGAADKVDFGERFCLLQIIVTLDRYGPQAMDNVLADGPVKEPNPFMKLFQAKVDYEPAMRNANRWYDRIAKTLRIKDRTTRTKQLQQIATELKSWEKGSQDSTPGMLALLFMQDSDKIRGKAIGYILIGLMCPAVIKVQDSVDRCEQTQNNLYVAFALAAYRRDHGRYPKELETLVPKYLDKIPKDLFADKPPIYRSTENGFLLYSVGINGRDEQGQSSEDDPQGDDLSIRIPLPKLKQE